MMMEKQQGFTLIELVAVIVILGALAVVALPRFVDLQDEAQQASVEGVAGGISSAFAVNFAAASASSSEARDVSHGENLYIGSNGEAAPGTPNFDIDNIMQSDLTDYEVPASGCGSWSTDDAPGATITCRVQLINTSVSAPFTAIATSSS